MRKETIIINTFKGYIEDQSTRAAGIRGCHYLNDRGNMCAVGKCMLSKYKKMNPACSVQDIGYEINHHHDPEVSSEAKVDEFLLAKYRGHSEGFWVLLQHLHDLDDYWGKNGITKKGKTQLKAIADKYNLDINKIEKGLGL